MSAHTYRGVVYFAIVGDYVKIGYSSRQDILKRLTHLWGGRVRPLICPDDVDRTHRPRLIHTIPGCIMRDERRIQGLFAAHHVVGEWFRLSPEFLRQLAALEYVTDAEVLRNFRDARRQLKRSRTAYLRPAA